MRVVALNRFEYANKLRLPGDEFDTTSDADAEILVLAQQVKIAPDQKSINNRALKADTGKQRYRHRAMRADE